MKSGIIAWVEIEDFISIVSSKGKKGERITGYFQRRGDKYVQVFLSNAEYSVDKPVSPEEISGREGSLGFVKK